MSLASATGSNKPGPTKGGLIKAMTPQGSITSNRSHSSLSPPLYFMTPNTGAQSNGAQEYHQIINNLNVICLTILLFDHLLTFGDEVKYIWNKLTPLSVLFLINRYLGSVTMICYVVGAFLPFSVQENLYPKFQPGVIAVVQTYPTVIIAEAILILRVYAVYQHNRWVLTLFILTWVAHIVVGATILVAHKVRPQDLMNMGYALNLRLGLSFFIPAILFDGMVAGFLTIGLYRRFRYFVSEMSLVNLIIRDGLLYFFAVFGSNIVWMIIGFVLCNSEASSLGFAPMYVLSAATTTTMIGRLTLSLKGYQKEENHEFAFNTISMGFMPNTLANISARLRETVSNTKNTNIID